MSLRVDLQALLLAALTLMIFYPSLSAPLSPVDDRALVQWLYNNNGATLSALFSRTTDYFYRPILLSSYLLDFHLWGAETSFMHLHNIVLHTLNALLLFICAKIIFNRFSPETVWAPFFAAAFFAVHPVNTEAVIWISGRSDLLACTFVLMSTLLLFKGLAQGRAIYAYFSLLALVPGFFAKETAVFFIPAAVILILFDDAGPRSSGFLDRLKTRLCLLVPYLVLPPLYLAVRGNLTRDAGLSLVRQFITEGYSTWVMSLESLLVGLGFYAKKLVFPWPLNFTISHISPYYLYLGILVCFLLAVLVFRHDVGSGHLLAAACILSSALLAILLRPAWTPVAERYLYLPSTFFCLSMAVFGHRLASRTARQWWIMPFLLMGLFTVFAVASLQRNFLWQDNVLLFEDAAKKSPDFPFARSVLAQLLIETGRQAEGRDIIRANTAPEGLRNGDFLDLKRAELLMSEGNYVAARQLILDKRRKESQLYYEFQKVLVNVDLQLLQFLTGEERQEIAREIVMLFEELARVYRESFYIYRLGHFYLQEGDHTNAGRSFRRAADGAPTGAFYKLPAAKLADKLLQR